MKLFKKRYKEQKDTARSYTGRTNTIKITNLKLKKKKNDLQDEFTLTNSQMRIKTIRLHLIYKMSKDYNS